MIMNQVWNSYCYMQRGAALTGYMEVCSINVIFFVASTFLVAMCPSVGAAVAVDTRPSKKVSIISMIFVILHPSCRLSATHYYYKFLICVIFLESALSYRLIYFFIIILFYVI